MRMREIKFRGKRKDNGEWVYGCLCCIDNEPVIVEGSMKWVDGSELYCNTFHFVIPETIGQYTGLKDKNGKEIYKGDIVKGSNSRVAYVTFLQQEMGYVLAYHNNDTRLLGHRNTGSSYDIDFNIEVIGNIWYK